MPRARKKTIEAKEGVLLPMPVPTKEEKQEEKDKAFRDYPIPDESLDLDQWEQQLTEGYKQYSIEEVAIELLRKNLKKKKKLLDESMEKWLEKKKLSPQKIVQQMVFLF